MSKRNKVGDELLRKKNARLRFKRLLRVALSNVQWITELENAGITMNVKKNVAMLVRKKHKTGILTMDQKGMLVAPHQHRTIEERKKLCLIVAALGCFTQVPPKLRARLVPHLRFMSIAMNRVLMKEGDEPLFVYFVVSGEIEMSRRIYNNITRKHEQKPEAFCGPGDWIGDVELIESDVRGNTFKALTQCEILVLDEPEFKEILMPYLMKVWVEKKRAIAALSYLKYMTNAQVVSACKFGILRQYDPLDTIFPETKDNVNYVHFVLSGECVLLQCLNVKVTQVKGEANYELVDAVAEDSDSDIEEDKGDTFDVRELLRSSSSINDDERKKKKMKRKAELAKIELGCELLRQKLNAPPEEEKPTLATRRTTMYSRSSFTSDYDDYHDWEDEHNDDHGFSPIDSPSPRESIRRSKEKAEMWRQKESIVLARKLASVQLEEENIEGESEESEIFTASSGSSKGSVVSKKKTSRTKIDDHRTQFVDIGSMSFGGLFGVGEKCDYRVVMARTTVQCLLIPLYWLMEEEQNPGHMWQRMRFYLDRCLPSRESLFLDYINTRKWAQFKKDCVEPFTHSIINPTKIQDIPIVIRIIESKDDEEE